KQLEKSYASDTHVLALLKIMSLLVGYMKLEKADVHPDTANLLKSAFQCMESVAENKGISTHKKIRLIRKEIDSFNKFKIKISPCGEPSAKKTMSRTGETAAEDSEPAPIAEPSLTTETPGEIFVALAALKSGVDGLKEAFTSSEDSKARVCEELTALKGRMDDLRGLSEDLDNVRCQLGEEFVTLKDQVNSVKMEVSRLRDDLLTVRSKPEAIRGAVCQVQAAPPIDESAQDEAGIKEVEEFPEHSEATDWHLLEQDIIVEEPSSADKPQELQTDVETTSEGEKPTEWGEEAPDSSFEEREPEEESPTSGSYFLFQMGGKKYAVDEGNVIKASKSDRHLLKKASDKGELRMIDCKRMFSSIKRGIEPTWNHLSSKDLEKTTFRLLTDDRIDGLLDTNGGGMLFLGSGEKRSILFTDQLPKKKRLSRKNKVKSLSGLEYVCGAIQKSGDSTEQYLILDADQLCKRLRVSIPALFTKI
ncbi:MAG: hypothetical protein JRF50_16155, partial [Deltaproteobacteria bacterium]|nr:hypothetical protein [Deltaproteobacteria bacterium]